MENDTTSLKEVIEHARPYIKAAFDTHILPKIQNSLSDIWKKRADKSKFNKQAVNYLAQTYGKCSILNTIAFQNSPKKLLDLYVPIKLKKENAENDEFIAVDEEFNLLSDSTKMLVIDGAGMGKSTLSKRVVLTLIDRKDCIPVFYEMRGFNRKLKLVDEIKREIGLASHTSDTILSSLPFVFIFDGFDEVSLEDKDYTVKQIIEFSQTKGANALLITSRPEPALNQLVDYDRFSVLPMEKDEAFELLRKYDDSGEISSNLIKGVKGDTSGHLAEFLKNPLYVSLLFCSYRHKPILPNRKHIFYSQVYDALFEGHDLTKEPGYSHEKLTKLDCTEFHQVLRRLAFVSLKKNGTIEFQKDELEIIISRIEEKMKGVSFKAIDFIHDICSQVPIFIREGNLIRWSHKSLQEYFSAMFICNDTKEKQKDTLLTLYGSKDVFSYINILELCCDIDYSTYRATITKSIIENFISYRTGAYTEKANRRVKSEWVEDRIALTFAKQINFTIIQEKSLTNDILEKSFNVLELESLKPKEYSIAIHASFGSGFNRMTIVKKEADAVLLKAIKHREASLFRTIKEGKEPKVFSIPKNKTVYVTDSPKAIINNSKNFPIVNNILAGSSEEVLDHLQVNNAMKELGDVSEDGIAILLQDFC